MLKEHITELNQKSYQNLGTHCDPPPLSRAGKAGGRGRNADS